MLGTVVLGWPVEHQPSSLDNVAMEAELPLPSLLAVNVAPAMLRRPSNRDTGVMQFRILVCENKPLPRVKLVSYS